MWLSGVKSVIVVLCGVVQCCIGGGRLSVGGGEGQVMSRHD